MQRAVAVELYALMRITRSPSRHGYVLGPGELDHSLRFIARRVPGCTKDVVEGVANALRRAGFLTTRKPTGAPTRAVVRKLACFADLAESGPFAADSGADTAGDDPPTSRRHDADEPPTQETEADGEGDADQERGNLFSRLFRRCPLWEPTRRGLTTERAHALWREACEREALDLLARYRPNPDRRVTP
jgi:hypothetical protein